MKNQLIETKFQKKKMRVLINLRFFFFDWFKNDFDFIRLKLRIFLSVMGFFYNHRTSKNIKAFYHHSKFGNGEKN